MIYDAECLVCGREEEYSRHYSQCYETPMCCGISMKKVIKSAPSFYLAGNFEAFKSQVDGSIIRSGRELSEHNKRNNVLSLSDGYTTEQLMSDDFGKKKEESNTAQVKAGVVKAYQKVKQGYKPKMETYDE